MRIAVIGGGPGGLYLAALMKALRPDARDHGSGSATHPRTPSASASCSPTRPSAASSTPTRSIHARMAERFARWDDIDVHFRGTLTTVGGQGFAAMSRKELLRILQERCAELGVARRLPHRGARRRRAGPRVRPGRRRRRGELRRPHQVRRRVRPDAGRPPQQVHVAGHRPGVRGLQVLRQRDAVRRHADPRLPLRRGAQHVHRRDARRRLAPGGLRRDRRPRRSRPGVSDEDVDRADPGALGRRPRRARDPGQQLQVAELHHGHATARWRHGNVVLLGDAAHTAHFSIGSGTKLAMEDALALVACLHEQPDVDTALAAYEAERRPVVVSTQRAAQASLEWFENIGQYVGPGARAVRVQHAHPQPADHLRQPAAARPGVRRAAMDAWFATAAGSGEVAPADVPAVPARRGWSWRTGSSSRRWTCTPPTTACPTDFHLVHLGAQGPRRRRAGDDRDGLRLADRAGSPPAAPASVHRRAGGGLGADRRLRARAEHRRKIGLQLGHSGRKGSTKLMWEGIDEPLPDGQLGGRRPLGRAVLAGEPGAARSCPAPSWTRSPPSSSPAPGPAPAPASTCSSCTARTATCSPRSSRRCPTGAPTSTAGRWRTGCAIPLEVFDAVRAAWPADRPISVRISATDWCEGGNDVEDAVAIARAFAEHGADAIHVSTGQVVKDEEPAFGRSYQTPYADRIRAEVGAPLGVAVIAVGAIASYDDVNSILLAGRADLVAVGRPHLYDPHWTLHAAAEQEYDGPGATWPAPYLAGRRRPPTGRTDGPPPRLELIRRPATGTRHARWRPGRRTRAEARGGPQAGTRGSAASEGASRSSVTSSSAISPAR